MTTKLSPPSKRSTITDVANLAGVSISTVSRVVNKTAPVADETVRRVQQAIESLGFQPHPVARSLAGGKTHTLGILVPELTNPFFSLLMHGVEQGMKGTGFDLLVHLTRSARSQNGRTVYPLGEHNTDGLLIFTSNMANAEMKRLHEQGFPLVSLFRTAANGDQLPAVTVDNLSGARAAVDHLIEGCNRQRIALIRGLPNNTDSEERELGYRQSLEAHNIPFDPALVARGDFTAEHCEPLIRQWLAEGVSFDAIFADNDILAHRLMTALHKAGIKIPQDVSLVGFDDLPLAQQISPALTTVHSPIVEAGRRGVALLIETIREGMADSVILPTKLIVRSST